MNKILLNVCLVLITLSVIYTVFTLPATLSQSIRTEANSFMTEVKDDVIQSVNDKLDSTAQNVTDGLTAEVNARLDKIIPADMSEEDLNAYIAEIFTDVIEKNINTELSEDVIVEAIKQILKESIAGLE